VVRLRHAAEIVIGHDHAAERDVPRRRTGRRWGSYGRRLLHQIGRGGRRRQGGKRYDGQNNFFHLKIPSSLTPRAKKDPKKIARFREKLRTQGMRAARIKDWQLLPL
jgi:hypothetical protein